MFRKFSVIATLCLFAAAGLALDTLEPGQKAPRFELFGVDYRYHSMEMYPDAKAFVLMFTCNHCPVAKAYEDKLIALAKQYQPRGIQFLAINPNPADMQAQDGFPQMRKRAEEKGFPYPYLYDETQKTARAYGATVTPHIFVVGPDREILYEGAVDNRHDDPQYLASALDAILAGESAPQKTTAEWGCTVKYRPHWAAKEKEAGRARGN